MQIIRDPQAFWESFNNCTPKTGLLIYGEGKLLKQFADYLTNHNVDVHGVIISKKNKYKNFCGYRVFHKEDLLKKTYYIMALNKPRLKLKNAIVLFNDEIRTSFLISPIRNKYIGDKRYSFITNNCSGGVIYGLLDMPYLSPTVGTAIEYCDYIKLATDPHYYFSQSPNFLHYENSHNGYLYPVGKIGDVTIRFVHYKTWDEVVEKWSRRVQRINYDNLFFLLDEAVDSLNYCDEQAFLSTVKGKKIVIHRKNYYGMQNTMFTTKNFFDNQQLIDTWFDIIEVLKIV